MNGNLFLADTNAILNLLNGNSCMKQYVNSNFLVSIISEMELLGYSSISQDESDIIKKFLSLCKIENISTDIKEKTIELRKLYNIKLPDAIIASTAIINSVPLLSADTIFSKISELNFIRLQP